MDSGSESDFEFVRLVARTGRESCDDDAESLGVISLDSDEVVASPTSSGSPGASAVIQAAEEPGSVGLSQYDHLQDLLSSVMASVQPLTDACDISAEDAENGQPVSPTQTAATLHAPEPAAPPAPAAAAGPAAAADLIVGGAASTLPCSGKTSAASVLQADPMDSQVPAEGVLPSEPLQQPGTDTSSSTGAGTLEPPLSIIACKATASSGGPTRDSTPPTTSTAAGTAAKTLLVPAAGAAAAAATLIAVLLLVAAAPAGRDVSWVGLQELADPLSTSSRAPPLDADRKGAEDLAAPVGVPLPQCWLNSSHHMSRGNKGSAAHALLWPALMGLLPTAFNRSSFMAAPNAVTSGCFCHLRNGSAVTATATSIKSGRISSGSSCRSNALLNSTGTDDYWLAFPSGMPPRWRWYYRPARLFQKLMLPAGAVGGEPAAAAAWSSASSACGQQSYLPQLEAQAHPLLQTATAARSRSVSIAACHVQQPKKLFSNASAAGATSAHKAASRLSPGATAAAAAAAAATAAAQPTARSLAFFCNLTVFVGARAAVRVRASTASAAGLTLPAVLSAPAGNETMAPNVQHRTSSAASAVAAAVRGTGSFIWQRVIRPTKAVPALYRPAPPCLMVMPHRQTGQRAALQAVRQVSAIRPTQHAPALYRRPPAVELAAPATREAHQSFTAGGHATDREPEAAAAVTTTFKPDNGVTLPMLAPLVYAQPAVVAAPGAAGAAGAAAAAVTSSVPSPATAISSILEEQEEQDAALPGSLSSHFSFITGAVSSSGGGSSKAAAAPPPQAEAAPGGLTLPMLPPITRQGDPSAFPGGLTLPMLPPIMCTACGTHLQLLPPGSSSSSSSKGSSNSFVAAAASQRTGHTATYQPGIMADGNCQAQSLSSPPTDQCLQQVHRSSTPAGNSSTAVSGTASATAHGTSNTTGSAALLSSTAAAVSWASLSITLPAVQQHQRQQQQQEEDEEVVVVQVMAAKRAAQAAQPVLPTAGSAAGRGPHLPQVSSSRSKPETKQHNQQQQQQQHSKSRSGSVKPWRAAPPAAEASKMTDGVPKKKEQLTEAKSIIKALKSEVDLPSCPTTSASVPTMPRLSDSKAARDGTRLRQDKETSHAVGSTTALSHTFSSVHRSSQRLQQPVKQLMKLFSPTRLRTLQCWTLPDDSGTGAASSSHLAAVAAAAASSKNDKGTRLCKDAHSANAAAIAAAGKMLAAAAALEAAAGTAAAAGSSARTGKCPSGICSKAAAAAAAQKDAVLHRCWSVGFAHRSLQSSVAAAVLATHQPSPDRVATGFSRRGGGAEAAAARSSSTATPAAAFNTNSNAKRHDKQWQQQHHQQQHHLGEAAIPLGPVGGLKRHRGPHAAMFTAGHQSFYGGGRTELPPAVAAAAAALPQGPMLLLQMQLATASAQARQGRAAPREVRGTSGSGSWQLSRGWQRGSAEKVAKLTADIARREGKLQRACQQLQEHSSVVVASASR